MATLLGSGDYQYEVDVAWGKLPDGWTYKEAAAVGVDGNDNVYVFSRGDHPMVVFDRHGNFLRSWGEDLFVRAHGVSMGPDESIYCTDDGDHTVRKCTYDGKVLLGTRRAGPGGCDAQRPAVQPAAPTSPCARTPAPSTWPTATATRACTSTTPTASCSSRGVRRAPTPASSTSCTTSVRTKRATCTSPTARTTVCRYSTATASTRRRGATCTAPAACSWTATPPSCATSANWDPAWR